MPRVSRSTGPVRANAVHRYATDARTLNATSPFTSDEPFAAHVGIARQDDFVGRLLHPEPGRIDHELLSWGQRVVVGDREERDAVKRDLLDAGVGVEDPVEQQMTCLVGAKARSRRPRGT